MAAVLGGTQSLHTNGFDEALSLPTERAARIALRTQQIIGYESGVVDTPDPLAGSYFVESLTDEVERLAWEYIEKIDEMGGAVAAIEAGYQMDEIEQAAYEYAKSIDDGERVIVGVNRFAVEDEVEPDILAIDPLQSGQVERVRRFKADRDQADVETRQDVAGRGGEPRTSCRPCGAALAANARSGRSATPRRVRRLPPAATACMGLGSAPTPRSPRRTGPRSPRRTGSEVVRRRAQSVGMRC